MLLYIERWLKAPAQLEDGSLIGRNKGTPQGGVISPLLANIFLHHVFDEWMRVSYPKLLFSRIYFPVSIVQRAKLFCGLYAGGEPIGH